VVYYVLFLSLNAIMTNAKKTASTTPPVAKKAAAKKATPVTKKKEYGKLSLALHKKLHGKLSVVSKGKLETRDEWSMMYTPGVGAVSSYLAKHPKEAREYTIKKNTVAVISDGSAVLGLGNLGAVAALPVMEGKCAIFKEMAGVDAFPIVLGTQDTEEIIAAIKAIAPTFGGINLEDISAPRCFVIEERLKKELDIPVMHDDQHGTAVVVTAGLLNAAKVVGKKFESLRVVVVGAGAAGRAITLLLQKAGISHIIVTDSKGAIYTGRPDLTGYKKELATSTNPDKIMGDVMAVVAGADVIVGVSGPGTIAAAHIEKMAKDAIVFALANPIPEIMPEDAKRAGAVVVATGRSDYGNQVNNALVFPGIFRGALDRNIQAITDDMKLAAAKKLASLVKNPTAEEIIPSVMMPGLVKAVASVIK
jgi:malate dehydrogenase (oxaloacetate-decarboxylating)